MSDPHGMPLNPYVGPRAFTRKDTLFGRDVEKVNLLDLLISERIVLLYSPSGAGKTSLIQAGIVPALEEEHFRPLPVIRVNRVSPHPNSSRHPHPPAPLSRRSRARGALPPTGAVLPAPRSEGRRVGDEGSAPNRYITSALHSLAEGLPGHTASGLDDLTLSQFLDRLDGDESQADGTTDPVVLIFDQFEEILTIESADLAVKEAFFAQVGEALRARHRWALFSMREEYVAALDPYLRHLPTRLATTFRLGLLEPPAAAEAIQKPAALAGVDFTDPAAAALIAELVNVRVPLPDGTSKDERLPFIEPVQLQVVCTRFWERLPWAQLPVRGERRQIEEHHVAELAQVDDALGDYYDAKVATVATAMDADAPRVLERQIREWIDANLITERGTRAQLRVGAEREQTLPDGVIQELVDAYLIRREGRPGDRWYELAHDRLVQPIKESNSAWLREHLDPVQLRARQWDETGRRRESLLRGAGLARARNWATANTSVLPAWERALLTDFLGDSERERRVRNTRIALMAGAGLAALVLVLVFFNSLSYQRAAETENRLVTDALTRERNVTQSNLLASQAEARLQTGDLDLALLLAAAGVETADTLEARRTLLQALTAQPGLVAYLGRQTTAPTTIAVSPNGAMAASAACAREEFPCAESEIRLWDLTTRQPLGELPNPDGGAAVLSLAFSPDNQTLAAGTADRGVVLWDLPSGDHLGDPLVGSERAVSSVAFNGDGATLAAGSTRGTIVLWDVRSRQPRHDALTGHLGQVTSLVFAPDGTLASGGRDGSVLVWDGTSLRLRCGAAGDPGPNCAVVAPAGTPAADPAADAAGGGNAGLPLAPAGAILSLGFSPDGRWFAAGTGNGGVTIWETGNGRQRNQFRGQGAGMMSVAFSADGSLLSAVAQNRSLFRWELETGEPTVFIQTPGDFTAAAFAPDGSRFVAGDTAADVLLWDLQNPIPLAQRLDAGAPVASVAIAADGRTLAAGTSGGSVELWGVAAGERIWSSGELPRPVTSVVLSPDGRTVTAGSQDGVIYRWDPIAAAEPLRLEAHAGSVDALAASPGGQTLAAGGADGAVRLWDLAQPADPPSALAGHQGLVSAVAFSQDGQTLASGGADGAVRVWNLGDRGEPIVLEGAQGQIYAVAFRPTAEETLVAGGRGLSFWDVAARQRLGSLSVGSDATVYGVAFSPDGATLATAAADGRITLWDMGTNLELGALNGHTAAARSVGYSDDGTLVSGGDDGTVLVWSISTEAMLERACRIANRNLTPEERQEFMLNRPDRTTCPEHSSGAAPTDATP